jgi:WD40 repeat protein
MRFWDVSNGKMLKHFDEGHVGEVTHVVFSPDDKFALSGGHDHRVKLWDVATGEELDSFEGEHYGLAATVSFSPDGQRALGLVGEQVYVWDLKGSKLLWTIPERVLPQAAFTRDGRSVTTASFIPAPHVGEEEDRPPGTFTVITRDAATGKEQRRFAEPFGGGAPGRVDGFRLVAFHPDGDRVLTGGYDGKVRLWNLQE